MKGFIVGTIVTAIAFYVVTSFLPQFLPQFITYRGSAVGLLVLAAIFGVVNGVIGPIVRIFAFPLTMMTLGLIGFLINAGLLLLTAAIATDVGLHLTVGKFPPTLLSVHTVIAAVVGAALLSLVSSAVRLVIHD